jgi:hypothetical protein
MAPQNGGLGAGFGRLCSPAPYIVPQRDFSLQTFSLADTAVALGRMDAADADLREAVGAYLYELDVREREHVLRLACSRPPRREVPLAKLEDVWRALAGTPPRPRSGPRRVHGQVHARRAERIATRGRVRILTARLVRRIARAAPKLPSRAPQASQRSRKRKLPPASSVPEVAGLPLRRSSARVASSTAQLPARRRRCDGWRSHDRNFSRECKRAQHRHPLPKPQPQARAPPHQPPQSQLRRRAAQQSC